MIEFERRFKVNPICLDLIKSQAHAVEHMLQGYVCADDTSVVRVRYIKNETIDEWNITVKQSTGQKGKNFEYESVVKDASELFSRISKKISKTRYYLWHKDNLELEVDVFEGECAGLIIAEAELEDDAESDWLSETLPSWFGEELTGMSEYSNYSLCMNGLPK